MEIYKYRKERYQSEEELFFISLFIFEVRSQICIVSLFFVYLSRSRARAYYIRVTPTEYRFSLLPRWKIAKSGRDAVYVVRNNHDQSKLSFDR